MKLHSHLNTAAEIVNKVGFGKSFPLWQNLNELFFSSSV